MPFDRYSPEIASSLTNAFDFLFHEDLSKNHARRLEAYQTYWKFYLGRHWSYTRDEGENQTTINYCRKSVDKHVNFTFKHGFKTSIPDDPTIPEDDDEDREFVRALLEETWRKNNKPLWCLEAGQQGGVTGDLFARVSWEKNDPLESPYARVDIIPSHFCYPEFGGPHGVDRKKIKRMLIIVPVYRENESVASIGRYTSRNPRTMAPVSLVHKAEEWIAAEIVDGKIVTPSRVIYWEDGRAIKEIENPLGEIPIVHIPNYPLSGEYYGLSDLVDMTDLNQSLNEKVTDVEDIIAYHSAPTTVVYGAKLSDLERGVNKMWGAPADARIENLELKSDLGAAQKHIDRTRQYLMEMADLPSIVLGEQPKISNATGVAIQMQYVSMLERRNVKVQTYGMGLRLINRLILKVTEIADSGFSDKLKKLAGNPYRNEVTFPDPLPQDIRRQLEIDREELDLGLNTRRRILESRGYSQAEIKKILDAIEEERKKEIEFLMEKSDDGKPGPGSGKATFDRGGANETMGERIDDTLQSK